MTYCTDIRKSEMQYSYGISRFRGINFSEVGAMSMLDLIYAVLLKLIEHTSDSKTLER